MICKFQVGQKVLCIDDSVYKDRPDPKSYGVHNGGVYTIERLAIGHDCGGVIVFLAGVNHPEDDEYNYGLAHWRFRALDDHLLEPFREYCRTREDALDGLRSMRLW